MTTTIRRKKPLPKPKKTFILFCRVERELHQAASAAANAKYMSLSHWLRALVREATEPKP